MPPRAEHVTLDSQKKPHSTHGAEAAKPDRPTPGPADEVTTPSRAAFPIVGIGASAGGLEALEQFVRHMPGKTGMAFVVIQHLDPAHKGAMVELLQRATTMRVAEVQDRLKVEPTAST